MLPSSLPLTELLGALTEITSLGCCLALGEENQSFKHHRRKFPSSSWVNIIDGIRLIDAVMLLTFSLLPSFFISSDGVLFFFSFLLLLGD